MKEERDIKENKGRLSGEAEIDEALELLRTSTESSDAVLTKVKAILEE